MAEINTYALSIKVGDKLYSFSYNKIFTVQHNMIKSHGSIWACTDKHNEDIDHYGNLEVSILEIGLDRDFIKYEDYLSLIRKEKIKKIENTL